MMKNVKVVFVCMGNICRSPSAEGVFKKLVNEHGLSERISIDSAGTHAYHVGEPPDSRAQSAALNRSIDISHQRARQFKADDFETFGYVLVMDRDNLQILKDIYPKDSQTRLSLFLSFAPELSTDEVPDPYYGGSKGFEHVLDLIEEASKGLLTHIREHNLSQ